jgi:PAS domain-containing protein
LLHPGAERLFGYSADEAVGKPVNILIPEDRQNEEPAMRRIGEALRRVCDIPRKLPLRLYDLVAQLRRATKEDDYRHNAAELMRLAENAQSDAEKTHLVTLAEGWIELAEKAHNNNRRPRQPTILHPLVEKKMGKLPD